MDFECIDSMVSLFIVAPVRSGNQKHRINIRNKIIMKKLITIAVVTVVGFFASHALADGIPFIPQIINFDLVYQTQGADIYTNTTSGTVTTYTSETHKGDKFRVSSKDIIKLIGAAFETNFPSGSQLALAFYGSEIVIMDATGTNVIFYPNEATPPNSAEWGFYVGADQGIQWGKDVYNTLGDENEDYTVRSIFHISMYNSPTTLTPGFPQPVIQGTNTFDLTLSGLITYHYTFTRDHSNHKWVEKANTKFTEIAGEGPIGYQYGILTGKATSHGSARGTEE